MGPSRAGPLVQRSRYRVLLCLQQRPARPAKSALLQGEVAAAYSEDERVDQSAKLSAGYGERQGPLILPLRRPRPVQRLNGDVGGG